MEKKHTIVGERMTRTDSLAKVTGKAPYTADIKLPGMLNAKVIAAQSPDLDPA